MPPQETEPLTGQTVPPSPPLATETNWWETVAAGWPDQALIHYLDDPQQRAAELARLRTDLDQLPPWDDVHRSAAAFTGYMGSLYGGAASWLAEQDRDAAYLATLTDRQYVAALKHRAEGNQLLAIEA